MTCSIDYSAGSASLICVPAGSAYSFTYLWYMGNLEHKMIHGVCLIPTYDEVLVTWTSAFTLFITSYCVS